MGGSAAHEEIGDLLGGVGIWFTSEFTTSTPILQRLFIAHVAILPLLLIGLMAAHFYLVKHHGISSVPGHKEGRAPELTDTQAAIRREGFEPFTNHLVHILGWGLVLTALGSLLALVIAAPLGEVIEPGEEKTKPPWMFLPLYPFEDWIGIRALLWMPIAGLIGLGAVPFVDRFGSSSLRRRWVLLVAAVVVIAALVALGIYAQTSTPAEHVPGMEGE